MQDRNAAGKIILLNGPSSSGNSTLARALQKRLSEPFWHFSIDHLREADVLPMERIRAGEFDWPSIRQSFFDGFHRCLPALADAGNNLIVEHIIETQEWMDELVDLLSSFDVFFVRVHCALPELERRELDRGDRRIGEARDDFRKIHAIATYDFELDSTDSLDRNIAMLLSSTR